MNQYKNVDNRIRKSWQGTKDFINNESDEKKLEGVLGQRNCILANTFFHASECMLCDGAIDNVTINQHGRLWF